MTCEMIVAADRIGAHFIVDFSGPEPSPRVAGLIREGRIGGVILFAKNIYSVTQVRALTADLQRLAAASGLPPLFICIDQEGGAVNRISDGIAVLPGAMALGAAGREDDAETAGRITAQELRALGINTNHAPVLDVNTNPLNPIIGMRAFGEDPAQVARLGCAYLRGLQAEGVLATIKHFPGHGDTLVDSHLELPVIDSPREALQRRELVPFADAIRAGADGVMVGHLLFPALDPDLPASLSAAVVQGLLRDELGFDGLVFTDAMTMKAVADRWPRGEAAVMALAAGADLVLACGDEEAQWASLHAARDAVAHGVLDPHRLSISATRIARIRSKYARPGAGDEPGAAAHVAAAAAIADRAVTLVRNRERRIPLAPGRTVVVPAADTARPAAAVLHHELAQRRPDVELGAPEALGSGPWPQVVVATMAWKGDGGAPAVQVLVRRFGEGLIVVGAGHPYELAQFPEVATYLAAYGPDAPSLRAAARVLAGELTPTGRLPVTIPGLHPRGHRAEV